MITNHRIQPTTIPVSILAIAMLGATLLFSAVNSAASKPGKQSPSTQKEKYNRLINEFSPYLLQHATNPINWYPWGQDAFMTAKKENKPFYAGTYFPKNRRWGRPGLMELLPKITELWRDDHKKILESADQITRHIVGLEDRRPGTNPDQQTLKQAWAFFKQAYDPEHGGFGQPPKFPSPHQLRFLLRHYHHTQNQQTLAMVEKTLTQMRLGGIYDQLGFGFHRYSTDAQWLVPHFEKMLYDQAMLIMTYTEAYHVTGNEFYAGVAEEIIAYVLRDMTSAEGGFFSAEDADSEGIEGKFYLWTPQEIQRILGEKEAALFVHVFNVKEGGNFEDPGPGHHSDQNILHLQKPLPQLSRELDISVNQLRKRLEAGRKKLFRERQIRIHPFKDDKILSGWNGLMIAALANAGNVLDNLTYTAAAAKAADFILQNLSDDAGRLLKRYCKGEAGLSAHLNDYAFMVWGLLEIYQATFEIKYLKEAINLNEQMLSHFWDEQNGGLYMTADDGERLLVRSKTIYDGAIPSGNSVAAFNLLRLGYMTGKAGYLTKAEGIIKSFAAEIEQHPAGHSQLMAALEFALNPNYEVVIVGKRREKDTMSMLSALRKPFLPQIVTLFRPADHEAAAEVTSIAPYTLPMTAKDGRATAYVCQEFACKLPTTSADQMLENIMQN